MAVEAGPLGLRARGGTLARFHFGSVGGSHLQGNPVLWLHTLEPRKQHTRLEQGSLSQEERIQETGRNPQLSWCAGGPQCHPDLRMVPS